MCASRDAVDHDIWIQYFSTLSLEKEGKRRIEHLDNNEKNNNLLNLAAIIPIQKLLSGVKEIVEMRLPLSMRIDFEGESLDFKFLLQASSKLFKTS
jgi:hypothetical protein